MLIQRLQFAIFNVCRQAILPRAQHNKASPPVLAVIRNRRLDSVALLAPLRSVQFSAKTLAPSAPSTMRLFAFTATLVGMASAQTPAGPAVWQMNLSTIIMRK